VTTTASTTIAGVSVLTEDERSGDLFDLALSADGIEIRRADRPARRLSWARVSAWELEERRDDLVLTLRGDGATAPLRITGWSADDLDALMRSLSSGAITAPRAAGGAPAHDGAEVAAAAEAEPAAADAAAAEDAVARGREPRLRTGRRRVGAKAVLTAVLLVVLATAVTLVLLQSAGVIDWGFLGPTA
jgi:hypothetical protein